MVIIDVEYECIAIKKHTLCITDEMAEELKKVKNKNIYNVADICDIKNFFKMDKTSTIIKCMPKSDGNALIYESA